MARLPTGYVLDFKKQPDAEALNKLLSYCDQPTHSPKRLRRALEHSFLHLSILDEVKGDLVGYVRATSDRGLNANLWNLVALPGSFQDQFFSVLVYQALRILKRDMPGCSISIAAPKMAINSLQANGFLVDPTGIRAMEFKFKKSTRGLFNIRAWRDSNPRPSEPESDALSN